MPRVYNVRSTTTTTTTTPLPPTLDTRDGTNPNYSFSYGVSDQKTGDQKSQEERLINGVVRGSYSLVEPDGTIRRVTYIADKVNGFSARVEKLPAVSTTLAPPAPVTPFAFQRQRNPFLI